MVPIYKTKQQLQKRIDKYFTEEQAPAPRAFRFYLGLTKQMVYKYKKEKPEWYNIIIWGQEKILSGLEQMIIYGDLTKQRTTSIIFSLRAYDSEQYVPELRMNQVKEVEGAVIKLDFKQPIKKGER